MNTTVNNIIRRTLVAGALSALAATPALSQSSQGRWQAWVGCWSNAPAALSPAELVNLPVLCVKPVSQDVVEVATVSGEKVVRRDTIDASGTPRSIANSECNGTQTAQWSQDNRRVFVKSSLSCSGVRAEMSSILGMNEDGAWLDVRRVASGESANVRVSRYIPADVSGAVRGELGLVANDHGFASQTARIAAGTPLSVNSVVEASKLADSSVVESFLLERAQRFRLDGSMLVELADAGVPALITDAMVAVSNPNSFQVARYDSRAVQERDAGTGRRVIVFAEPCSRYGYYDPYFGGSAYNSYGYSNGCGYGYGYSNYGYSSFGYGSGYGYRPVLVYNVPSGQQQSGSVSGGRAVAGKGYTQTGTSSAPRPASSTTTSTSSGTSSSNSGSSSSNTSSTESSGRTAHTKP